MQDQINAPVWRKLMEYHRKGRISFAMPGHKNGKGLAFGLVDCDVTELDSTVDMYHGCAEFSEANRLLAKIYGSDESRILTEGSSAAIHAMISACLNPGETLLATADCHKSVVNTCALCGFNMRLFEQDNQAEELLDAYEDVRAVIVVSPDYYGVCRDISLLKEICHRHNLPLLVDEAHGAHFPASRRLPESAAAIGADIVCQSAHKTLNALTGAAYIHVNGGLINRNRLWQSLEMFSSTSPSYVIAASADTARAGLSLSDEWERLFDICSEFKRNINNKTNISVYKNDDFSRIVLDFSAYKASGFEIEAVLSKQYGIDIEMADDRRIVLILTPSNTREELCKLMSALIKVTDKLPLQENILRKTGAKPPQGLISPGKAFYSEGEEVPLDECINRISRSAVTVYPPGIPVIFPGCEITEEQMGIIKNAEASGAVLTGVEGGFLECVKRGKV